MGPPLVNFGVDWRHERPPPRLLSLLGAHAPCPPGQLILAPGVVFKHHACLHGLTPGQTGSWSNPVNFRRVSLVSLKAHGLGIDTVEQQGWQLVACLGSASQTSILGVRHAVTALGSRSCRQSRWTYKGMGETLT